MAQGHRSSVVPGPSSRRPASRWVVVVAGWPLRTLVSPAPPERHSASAARRRRLRVAAVSRRFWLRTRWLHLYAAELLTLRAVPFCSTSVPVPVQVPMLQQDERQQDFATPLRTESSKATAVASQPVWFTPLRTVSSKATAVETTALGEVLEQDEARGQEEVCEEAREEAREQAGACEEARDRDEVCEEALAGPRDGSGDPTLAAFLRMARDTRRRLPLLAEPRRPLLAICDGVFAQVSAVAEFPDVVPAVRALAPSTFSDKVPSRGTVVQASAGTTVPYTATSRGIFAQVSALASAVSRAQDVLARFSDQVPSCGASAVLSDQEEEVREDARAQERVEARESEAVCEEARKEAR